MLTRADLADVRRIVSVDMETTGNAVKTADEVRRMPKGMRLPGVIIQIGCVEILREGDGWATGRKWETLVNPDAPIHPRASKVHGIQGFSLKNAPRYSEVHKEFEDLVGDSPLLAHAAENEIGFLNYEIRRAKLAGWDDADPYHPDRFFDTQIIARDFFPGASGSLDALCNRLWIYPEDRDQKHGALLDADLTAEAFIKMATGFVRDEVRTFSV